MLGDNFPDKYKEDFAKRNLDVGSIFRLFMENTSPKKEKFIVLIAENEFYKLFAYLFVNTRINPHFLNSEELRKLHYPINPSRYDFLRHTSYIDCSQLYEYDKNKLCRLFKNDIEIRKGKIANYDLNKIISITKNAPTVIRKFKKKYNLF